VRSEVHDVLHPHESIDSVKDALVNQMDLNSTTDKNSGKEYYLNRVRRELNNIVNTESYVRNKEKPLRFVKIVRRNHICCCIRVQFIYFYVLRTVCWVTPNASSSSAW
jgi:hypothetical protein